MWLWAQACGIYLSCHVPHHPEVAGLIDWWNDLLKTRSQWQGGGNFLQGWGKVFQEAIYALIQHPIAKIPPTAKTDGSRNQKGIHWQKPLVIN